jgi:UDPglucose 6-dehydrogenase
LAELGNDVLCLDLDRGKIARLQSGEIPIYEPGLEVMVKHNAAAGRLRFTTDIEQSVRHGVVQFIAVGTPPDEDGSADLQHVLNAARSIGRHMQEYKVVVDKSTVPVGTADKVREAISAELRLRQADTPFSVVSNPEFLKEGAAVEDFMKPDRVVIGVDDARSTEIMRALYAPFQRNHERMLVMDVRSAELTKYAANAMLATRISFMNELSTLAEKLGADIEEVRRGMGSDPRIGYHFLYAGCGYGGSCFPKDVKALQRSAASAGLDLGILGAVEHANEMQKLRLVEKVVARFGERLDGHRFAIWGLAFKPNTDDMREAPSRVIIEELLKRGAAITAYDPVAMPEARHIFHDQKRVSYAENPMAALSQADALIVVTEWKEFRGVDLASVSRGLKQPIVFDGRNLYEPRKAQDAGLEYFSIGRK